MKHADDFYGPIGYPIENDIISLDELPNSRGNVASGHPGEWKADEHLCAPVEFVEKDIGGAGVMLAR